MRERIVKTLREIEKTQSVRILLAVESGSRAWGFASPDSDYDVRFIYVRPVTDYLRLKPIRDVIEMPIDDLLDISGWDLNKTLRLIYKSNLTIFEWFRSPIVYLETSSAVSLRNLMNEYFSRESSLYHYLSMTKSHYSIVLKGDMVKVKTYFYVLRPLLACRWIIDKGTPPPMLFSDLLESELDESLKSTVNELLDSKMNAPEIKQIRRIDILDEYIEKTVEQIQTCIDSLPREPVKDLDALDRMFLTQIGLQ